MTVFTATSQSSLSQIESIWLSGQVDWLTCDALIGWHVRSIDWLTRQKPWLVNMWEALIGWHVRSLDWLTRGPREPKFVQNSDIFLRMRNALFANFFLNISSNKSDYLAELSCTKALWYHSWSTTECYIAMHYTIYNVSSYLNFGADFLQKYACFTLKSWFFPKFWKFHKFRMHWSLCGWHLKRLD